MTDIVASNLTADIERSINLWLVTPGPGWTNATYLNAFRRVNIPNRKIPTLTHDEAMLIIQRMYADGYSPATVQTTVAAMSSLWGKLIKDGHVQSNPWHGQKLKKPKDKTAERVLDRDELLALIDSAISFRDATFLRFLYYSTMRISEAITVLWQDMRKVERPDGVHFFMTIQGKGGKTRTVEIPLHVVQDLVKLNNGHIKPDNMIWPFTRQWGHKIVSKTAERAGLQKNVSPHWLRHTGATDALDAGANIRVVQESLGHASLTTTQKYTHVRPEDRIAGYLPEV